MPKHKVFYNIRNVLEDSLKKDEPLTDDDLQKLFKAKNDFRSQLRDDIGLLFEEEGAN